MQPRARSCKHRTSLLAAAAVILVSSFSGLDTSSLAYADAVKLSREVGVPLKAATDLAQAGDTKGALAKLDAATAASKTAEEKYHIGTVRRYVYASSKSYAQLAPVLEDLIASGLMPSADAKTARRELVQVYDRAGSPLKAITAAKNYVSTYGHEPELTIYVASNALEAKDYKTASEWADKAIKGELAASRTPPETWYRVRMKAAYESKDMPAYYDSLESAVKVYPNETYWRALVSKARTQPDYSAERLELDEYRLLQAAGIKLKTEEKLNMAEAAFERELSGEALAILQLMEQSGELKADATKAARNLRLLAKAKTETEADRAALSTIVGEATRKGDALALANVAELSLSLGDAKGAAKLYTEALAKTGMDAATTNTVKLRLGIAQYRSGDVAGAKKTWAGLKGTDGAPDLAKTWQLVAAKS